MWRPSIPADRPKILEMCRELYREDPGSAPVPTENTIRTLDEFARDPRRGQALVLSVDGHIEGYALLASFWSNELGGEICVIDEIFVRPGQRGHGHAKNLITALMSKDRVWPRPYVAIDLEVTPQNSRAKALYERLGFKLARNTHLRFRF